MAKVYFWSMSWSDANKSRGGSKLAVSHLSLLLTDGTYISHWPMSNTTFKKGASPKKKLQDDVDLEGRQPDESFELPVQFIDEHLIKSWWESCKTSAEYQLVVNNCGQVVRRALVEGGIEEKLPWYHKHQYKLASKWLLASVTPLDSLKWVRYMVRLHTSPFFQI